MAHDDPNGAESPRPISIGGQLMAASLERSLFGSDSEPVRLGRFVIVDRIAGGGMGVVYRAFDPDLGRTVAIKVLAAGREHMTMRMRREAQILARLNHPNIVTVYETGAAEGRVYVAMELVVGGTLHSWCEQNPPGTRDRFARLLALAIQAARGLAAAHEAGLVHRDLKPGNLLIDADHRLRIADFGLARMADDETLEPHPSASASSSVAEPLTATGDVLGTPAYMPPEQFEGKSDARSDQWSLCATFWDAAYGTRWGGAGDLQRRSDVPSWFRDVLARGLADDPRDRHPDVQALLAELERRRGGGRRIATAVAASALVIAIAMAPRATESPCAATKRGLDGVWGGDVVAPTALPADVARRLDTYVERWREGAHAVCEGARAQGELAAGDDPLELPSRSMACYRAAREELRAVVEQLGGVDDDRTRRIAHALPELAACEQSSRAAAEDFGEGRRAAAALARASVALRIDDLDAARVQLDEANAVLAEHELPGLAAEAAMTEAQMAARLEHATEQEAAAKRALALAETAGDPVQTARAWTFVADAATDYNHFEIAELALERVASLTRVAGDPRWLVAGVRGLESRIAYARGDPSRAYVAAKEELAYLRDDGDPYGIAGRTLGVAQMALAAGDASAALTLARETGDFYERELGEAHPLTARARLTQGYYAYLSGDRDAAIPLLRAAADALAEASDVGPTDRASAHVVLATALRDARRFDEARAVIARGKRLAGQADGGEYMTIMLDEVTGEIEGDAGNYDAAIPVLEDVRRRLAALPGAVTAENRVTTCGNLAWAYAKAGRLAEAGKQQDTCIAELAALQSDSVALRGECLRYAGETYALVGRRDDARKAFRDALAVLGREGADPADAIVVHVALAELALDDGDRDGALTELALAEGGSSAALPEELRPRIASARKRLAEQ